MRSLVWIPKDPESGMMRCLWSHARAEALLQESRCAGGTRSLDHDGRQGCAKGRFELAWSEHALPLMRSSGMLNRLFQTGM